MSCSTGIFFPSPKQGCTQTALEEAASTIEEAGIGVDYFWIGNRPIQECIGCLACHKKNECVFNNDSVNDLRGQTLGTEFVGVKLQWNWLRQ